MNLVYFLAVLAVPLLERLHTQSKEYRSTFGTGGTVKNECKILINNALNSVPLLERSTTLIFSGMNPLDVPVSLFEDCTKPDLVDNRYTFLRLVTSKKLAAKYAALIQQIRNEPDPEKRKPLKKRVPAIAVSGLLGRRENEALLKHSRLLAFDIDPKENPSLNAKTAASLRDKLARFAHVLYCSLSVSGTGVWGVVAIENPEYHTEHFNALEADFAAWGLVIDKGCKDVSRLRFLSFDPDAIIKSEGAIYTKLRFPEVHQPKPWIGSTRPDDLATQAAEYLVREKKVVAFGYDDYFKIVTACKNSFGDNGESIAWDILENCPSFTVSNFRKEFTKKWKSAGTKVTGGTLVHLAKEAGFKYKQEAPTAAPQAIESTPTPAPANIVERFTNRLTGQSFERAINEHGYPAMIDEQEQPTASPLQQAAEKLAAFELDDIKVETIPDIEAEQNNWDNSPERLNALAIMRRAKDKEQCNQHSTSKAQGHRVGRKALTVTGQ